MRIELPWPPIPATTPSTWRLESGSGPKRSESSSAIGRAPIAFPARMIPPTPVAAPWYGSMAEGWLCDSILKTTAQPSPMVTAPAFSPGPCSTADPVDGRRRRSALELLYEQCSDQRTPSIPSSTSLGARFSSSTMARYSSGVSAPSRRRRSSTTATGGDLGERFGAQVVRMLGAAEHRSERIRRCVSEERKPQRRRRAAWAPKIRRGAPTAAVNRASRNQNLHRVCRDRPEKFQAVGAAELRLRASLGVGHHGQYVAACVDDARDVVRAPVWIGAVGHASVGVAIPEDHLSALLEPGQCGGVGEVVPLSVRDRDADHFALRALRGECQVCPLNDQVRPLAAKLERCVADESARQKACLAQHLESVADSPYQASAVGELADLLHDRRKPRDRACA